MLPFALTIFTGAFLLFQVQPLIGKYILPWFGGGPGVWTTCLLFFQTLLLGGYAYAHFSSTRLRLKNQVLVHCVLLALALALLPITPSDSWKTQVTGDPTWRILLLLTATIGLPYFVLSSTGPLMQQWFSQANPGVSPYRLYALSNIGSLLALLSYPIFFEVRFSRQTQATMWSAGLGVFVIVCGYSAWKTWRSSGLSAAAAAPEAADEPPDKAPAFGDRVLWLCLPALASVLLLATTNKLCQEVAVMPFLWVLPLALYLVSFIVCFDHARWYRRELCAALLVLGIAAVCQLLPAGNEAPLTMQVIGYTVTLFAACMICHGELYLLKPSTNHLTAYFLFISAGGALGGFLVAVVAPAVFREFWELQLGLWVLTYVVGVVCFRQRSRALVLGIGLGALMTTLTMPLLRSTFDDGESVGQELLMFYRDRAWWIVLALAMLVGCVGDFRRWRVLTEWRPRMVGAVMTLCFAVGAVFVMQLRTKNATAPTIATRNFYGTLKVFDYKADVPEEHYKLLLHGATTHGIQFVDPSKSMWPTTYYGERSGVGLAIRNLPEQKNKRLGLVGLGTGTLAVYGQEGDYLRIYEINPEVERLARTTFRHLADCRAKVDVVMGDARLMMERELAEHHSQQFDLLALDAFSSDAIPVHLLTKEAFTMYLQHLKPNGVIAVHISNRYLRLEPVVAGLAREFGFSSALIADDYEESWWIYRTTWILLTKNKALLNRDAISLATEDPAKQTREPVLWTDDHASLYQILK